MLQTTSTASFTVPQVSKPVACLLEKTELLSRASSLTCVFLCFTDYKTPQHIRASISGKTYEPASGPETKFQLNQAKNLIKHIHLSICTNWVTFAPKGGLSLGEAFHQRIHVPLKDMSYAPPSLMSNFTIFVPWAGAIALAVSGSPELVGKFSEHPLVLREINPGE